MREGVVAWMTRSAKISREQGAIIHNQGDFLLVRALSYHVNTHLRRISVLLKPISSPLHTLRDEIWLGGLQESKGKTGLFDGLESRVADEEFKVKGFEGLTLFGRTDGFGEECGGGLGLCKDLELFNKKLVDGRADVVAVG